MQQIAISVVRERGFRSGDGFQVYGDSGSGTIDYEHPLTSRRLLFWNDMPVLAGHLLDGHLMAVHLDGVKADGHLEGTHLLDEHGYPAATVVFETGPHVVGRFRHAVVTEDAIGNAEMEGALEHETVINSAPPPALDFVPVGHEAASDRVTFSFTPSDRLIG